MIPSCADGILSPLSTIFHPADEFIFFFFHFVLTFLLLLLDPKDLAFLPFDRFVFDRGGLWNTLPVLGLSVSKDEANNSANSAAIIPFFIISPIFKFLYKMYKVHFDKKSCLWLRSQRQQKHN